MGKSECPKDIKISVAGDVRWNCYRSGGNTAPAGARGRWVERSSGYPTWQPGGAWALECWVRRSAWIDADAYPRLTTEVHGPTPSRSDDLPTSDVLRSRLTLGSERVDDDPKDGRPVRVFHKDGFDCDVAAPFVPELDATHDEAHVVVLADSGNGFAESRSARWNAEKPWCHWPSHWPGALRPLTPEQKEEEEKKKEECADSKRRRPIVVVKSSTADLSTPLLRTLRREHKERLVVVVTVETLRARGYRIPHGLSWERLALDTKAALDPTTLRDVGLPTDLGRCKHVVVLVGLEGAIHYSNDGKGKIDARLIFDPERLEGDTRSGCGGQEVIGLRNCVVAGLAARLALVGLPGLEHGVRSGLIAARRAWKAGYGLDLTRPDDIQARACTAYPEGPGFGDATRTLSIEEREDYADPFGVVTLPNNDGESWRILDQQLTLGSEEPDAGDDLLAYLTKCLALRGAGPIHFPMPRAKFGQTFRTADRMEVEGYRAIQQLMREYVATDKVRRPLSIGVFGPPGSGKSFGVKSLAQSLGGVKVKPLEFNVSQFESIDDLVSALHRVRDAVVKDELPLAFFDEFDSSSLRWLKYFLAPMQDGTVVHRGDEHPIGRAIFVFAGGTSADFHSFAERDDADFIAAKGPDFVSRLRGKVDVKGPNPADDSASELRASRIRRAMLLHSLVVRGEPQVVAKKGNAVRMDLRVVQSFLRVPLYRHGSRSMESVLDMCLLMGKEHFKAEALPPVSQLALHVAPGKQLYALLDKPWTAQPEVPEQERIARAIHDQYRRDHLHRKLMTDDAMQPWERLLPELRVSNERLVAHLDKTLEKAGLCVRDAPDGIARPFCFTPRELEQLARAEHKRWRKYMETNGYVKGPRDHGRKTHSNLVDWEKLSEETREYDREILRGLPLALAQVGKEIVLTKAARRAAKR